MAFGTCRRGIELTDLPLFPVSCFLSPVFLSIQNT